MGCCSAGVGHALELPQRLCTWEAETDTYSVVPHSLPRCTFVFLGYWVVACGECRLRYDCIGLVADAVEHSSTTW